MPRSGGAPPEGGAPCRLLLPGCGRAAWPLPSKMAVPREHAGAGAAIRVQEKRRSEATQVEPRRRALRTRSGRPGRGRTPWPGLAVLSPLPSTVMWRVEAPEDAASTRAGESNVIAAGSRFVQRRGSSTVGCLRRLHRVLIVCRRSAVEAEGRRALCAGGRRRHVRVRGRWPWTQVSWISSLLCYGVCSSDDTYGRGGRGVIQRLQSVPEDKGSVHRGAELPLWTDS